MKERAVKLFVMLCKQYKLSVVALPRLFPSISGSVKSQTEKEPFIILVVAKVGQGSNTGGDKLSRQDFILFSICDNDYLMSNNERFSCV